jgi:phosphoribosylaminoimidazole-succinocarboxamide synthase
VKTVTERYIELYERITGKQFLPADTSDIENRIKENVNEFLARN